MAEERGKLSVLCGICCRPICDRYIMRVVDVSYHERCLACCICGNRLAHTCFTRDSKLYCRLDYDRLYVKKCLGCSERIGPEELVMRALDTVFHLRCFICVVCGVRLQKGDQFIIKQGQLFCRPDYEKEVEMLQGYAQGEFTCDELVQTARSQDGRRGPKRPRTILTTQQRRAFKASFEISPKPCRKVREALAKETGLSVRIVQVWFQNQRAKMKKIQKKARQENNKTIKDEENSDEKSSKMKIKEEEQSPLGPTSFLNDSCSDNEGNVTHMGIVGNPCDRFRLHSHIQNSSGEHNEEHHSSQFITIKQEIIDNEESIPYKTQIDASTTPMHVHSQEFISGAGTPDKLDSGYLTFPYSTSTLESVTHLPAHHRHLFLHHQGSPLGLNPIDRLYSMQTSYFCGEDAALVEQ